MFLLAACARSPTGKVATPRVNLTAEATPILIPSITPTLPSSTATATSPLPSPTTQPAGTPIVPLAEAPMLTLFGWSSDSAWLAYWAFSSSEAVNSFGVPGLGSGQLHFLNTSTGQACPYSDQAGFGASIFWQPDGSVIVVNDGLAHQSLPCDLTLTPVPIPTSQPAQTSTASQASRDKYTVFSETTEEADGTLSVETRFVDAQTGKLEHAVPWKHPGGVGELGLGGQWLTDDEFLIHRTLA